jgi:hypothetical protein
MLKTNKRSQAIECEWNNKRYNALIDDVYDIAIVTGRAIEEAVTAAPSSDVVVTQ